VRCILYEKSQWHQYISHWLRLRFLCAVGAGISFTFDIHGFIGTTGIISLGNINDLSWWQRVLLETTQIPSLHAMAQGLDALGFTRSAEEYELNSSQIINGFSGQGSSSVECLD